MSAQADRGTGPTPSRLKTTIMAKVRGIAIQKYSTRGFACWRVVSPRASACDGEMDHR